MGRRDVPYSGLIIPAIIATSGDNVKWLGKDFNRIMIHANDEVIRWCEWNDFDNVHVGIDKSGIMNEQTGGPAVCTFVVIAILSVK
jgi:hypothetical protein